MQYIIYIRVLNLVLASIVLFSYRILFFDIFIICGSCGRHFIPVHAGEK
jgi:hypothetical protein